MEGICKAILPVIKQINRAPKPEPKPFRITISIGFFNESIRVQLFSKPQQILAISTNREPEEKVKPVISSRLSIRQPKQIRKIDHQSLFPITS